VAQKSFDAWIFLPIATRHEFGANKMSVKLSHLSKTSG
jgi:hypothetical protein